MPTIKVRDLAYVRLRAPDLDAMEEFLTHFGLTRAARTPKALYMRGTDPAHHIHVTEKADDAGFVGFAYHAAGEGDLARVATAPGASAVEAIDEPGGGRRVRLREPNGYQIEVVWGLEALPPIPVDYTPMNTGAEPLRRAGTLMRLRKSPTPIKRIGHGVMGTPRVRETAQWFRDTLGFIGSDDVYVGDQGPHHRLVQPLRPRGRVRGPPRVLLRDERAGRHEPRLVRGAGRGRGVQGPRVPGRARQVRAHVGRGAASPGQPGLRLLVPTRGAACTSGGRTPTG